jgi:predicted short-subunit dehydrogenase-like oxidoreductase (DUF2520 family)
MDDFKLQGKVVAHTAASVPKEVLKDVTDHYGVFYPLQSLRKEMLAAPDVPIFVDGSDDKARKVLQSLARSISGEHFSSAGDNERLKLHVAAVVVSNFVNHLYALAEDYCKKEGLDFRQLLPLIEETALSKKTLAPLNAQTGPAARHDEETIQKHLALLDKHPHLMKIYQMYTESIQGI